MNADRPVPQEASSAGIPYWLRALLGWPLAMLGGLVTLSVGLILVASLFNRIQGGNPLPAMISVFVLWLILGLAPLVSGVFLLQAGSRGKRLLRRLLLTVLLVFLTVGVDGSFGPKNWHRWFRSERMPGRDAATLTETLVSPHLEIDVNHGTNLLWCGTFQLAWSEACILVGGDLQFDQDHPMIAELNKHSFTKESIDAGSYVAMAGFVKDSIHEKIELAVTEKFRDSFKSRLPPNKGVTPRAQDFVAYACLYKNLSFPVPFERLDEALTFAGVKVRAFGIGPHKASVGSMYPQVLIVDYQNKDDFVIELRTKSEGDRFILAKVQPKARFSHTVMNVRERSARSNAESALTNDVLVVPRMKLDLTRQYSEIEGRRLLPRANNIAKDLSILRAVQNTAFEMNEKGVELKSESHMAFGCARPEIAVPAHMMIFDKPFLILLEQRGAPMPYLAIWVDNPEMLIQW